MTTQPNLLMQGKRGLIMGVANSHSIAWGIAQALASHGAELAFSYQGEALKKRVGPLAQQLGVRQILFWEGDYIDARANKESLQAWMRAHAQALAPAGRP